MATRAKARRTLIGTPGWSTAWTLRTISAKAGHVHVQPALVFGVAEAALILLVMPKELIRPQGLAASAPLASLRAAVPSMSREIPVIIRFTPTSVPMAHTELDGQ